MNNMSANQDEIDMKLTQIGADVTSLHGIISFIHINVEQTELFYVYNINAKDQYFLQMVKPFRSAAGVFSRAQEMVQYIKDDVRQFKNASHSNVFPEFITVNQDLYESIKDIKDIFMTYNVPKEKMLEIKAKSAEIAGILDDIKRTCSTL